MTAYEDFLRAKVRLAEPKGFEVKPSAFHPLLKPHQRAIATWLVRQAARPVSRPSAWASR